MRSSFDILAERLAADIDHELFRRSLAMTPTERLKKLMEVQALIDEAKRAREREVARPDGSPR